jgi:hypothetical protein
MEVYANQKQNDVRSDGQRTEAKRYQKLGDLLHEMINPKQQQNLGDLLHEMIYN